jgi:hypothetical protein
LRLVEPFLNVVLEYFQRRSFLFVAGQPEMDAMNFSTRNTCSFFQPISGQVSLGRDRDTSKDLLVELSKPPPVLYHNIDVNESSEISHIRPLKELEMISRSTSARGDQVSEDYYCHVRTDNQASASRHNNTKPETRDYSQFIPKYTAEDKCYEKEG